MGDESNIALSYSIKINFYQFLVAPVATVNHRFNNLK